MNFIEIPRCKITLRCNYKCVYCPVIKSPRPEISGNDWIRLLVNHPCDEVIIEGGEPTLHRNFLQIINAVGGYKKVRIYSNGSFPIDMIDKIKVHTSWYISYHAHQLNTAEEIAKVCRKIVDSGHRLINVHTNAGTPTATPEDYQVFKDYGFDLLLEENFYKGDKWREYKSKKHGAGYCTYPRCYLDPSGDRYICVGKLEREDRDGIISHQRFPARVFCKDRNKCSVCDVMTEGVKHE